MPYDEDGDWYDDELALPEEVAGNFTINIRMDDHINASMNTEIINRVTALYKQHINKAIVDKIDEKIASLIDDEFEKMALPVVEAFFTKPHARTNSWGERNGEEVTMREIIQKNFDKWLEHPVDAKGLPDRNGRGSTQRLQFWINNLGKAPLQEAIDKTVSDISRKAQDQIQASVSHYIAQQLAPTIDAPPALEPPEFGPK